MRGTLFNQFFKTNPDRSPARPLAKNLKNQIQTIERTNKLKTEYLQKIINDNYESKL